VTNKFQDECESQIAEDETCYSVLLSPDSVSFSFFLERKVSNTKAKKVKSLVIVAVDAQHGSHRSNSVFVGVSLSES
jgi:hypothetical protein